MTSEIRCPGWIGHGLAAADDAVYDEAYAALCQVNNNATVFLSDDEPSPSTHNEATPPADPGGDAMYLARLAIGDGGANHAEIDTCSGDLDKVLEWSQRSFAALDGLSTPVTYSLETTLLRVQGPLGNAIDEVQQFRDRLKRGSTG